MPSQSKRRDLHTIVRIRSQQKGIDYNQAHSEVIDEIRQNPKKKWIVPVQ